MVFCAPFLAALLRDEAAELLRFVAVERVTVAFCFDVLRFCCACVEKASRARRETMIILFIDIN